MNIKIDQVKIYASIFIILLISALFVGCVSEPNDNDKESDKDKDKPKTDKGGSEGDLKRLGISKVGSKHSSSG